MVQHMQQNMDMNATEKHTENLQRLETRTEDTPCWTQHGWSNDSSIRRIIAKWKP